MKPLLLVLALLITPFTLSASKNININEVLQSITFHPDSIEIKEGESLQLEVTGHYDNGTEKNITTQVQWSIADSQIVTVDVNATLKALKEGKTTIIVKMENIEVSITIVIYKEINGHRLPPEPDKALNDSTLFGIDSNNNNVRDDVERWIYETYKDKHPIHIDIAMQAGRAWQKVLEDPTRAKEIYPIMDAVTWCEGYYQIYAKYFNEPILVHEDIDNKSFDNFVLNTPERKQAYDQYDTLLSGDTYSTPKIGEGKSFCDFNTSIYNKNR